MISLRVEMMNSGTATNYPFECNVTVFIQRFQVACCIQFGNKAFSFSSPPRVAVTLCECVQLFIVLVFALRLP